MVVAGGAAANTAVASPSESLPPQVSFPYGFPSAGTYRIFVQLKHDGQIETAVFDAQVAPAPVLRAQ